MATWILWIIELVLLVTTSVFFYLMLDDDKLVYNLLFPLTLVIFIAFIFVFDLNWLVATKIGVMVIILCLEHIAYFVDDEYLCLLFVILSMFLIIFGSIIYFTNSNVIEKEPSHVESISYTYINQVNLDKPEKLTFYYKTMDETKEISIIVVDENYNIQSITLPKSEVDIRSLNDGTSNPVLIEKKNYYNTINKNKKPYVVVKTDAKEVDNYILYVNY